MHSRHAATNELEDGEELFLQLRLQRINYDGINFKTGYSHFKQYF